MKNIITILLAAFVVLLVIEFGQAHEGHRHPNPAHRPLPVRRPLYGHKPAYRPYTKPSKPFIKPGAAIPFPGKVEKPETTRPADNGTQ